jgi:hypothetical protein
VELPGAEEEERSGDGSLMPKQDFNNSLLVAGADYGSYQLARGGGPKED